MSILIDVIGSTILAATLFVGVMNINLGMSNETDKALIEQLVQADLVGLERLVEYDVLKAGHAVPKAGAVMIADTSRLKFKANLTNVSGATDEVDYELGALVASSPNPLDRILYRRVNGSSVRISYRVTQFRLTYFDRKNAELSAPVTGANLDSIKSIRLQMRVEFPEPVDTAATGLAPYLGQTHRQLFFPMNLQ